MAIWYQQDLRQLSHDIRVLVLYRTGKGSSPSYSSIASYLVQGFRVWLDLHFLVCGCTMITCYLVNRIDSWSFHYSRLQDLGISSKRLVVVVCVIPLLVNDWNIYTRDPLFLNLFQNAKIQKSKNLWNLHPYFLALAQDINIWSKFYHLCLSRHLFCCLSCLSCLSFSSLSYPFYFFWLFLTWITLNLQSILYS